MGIKITAADLENNTFDDFTLIQGILQSADKKGEISAHDLIGYMGLRPFLSLVDSLPDIEYSRFSAALALIQTCHFLIPGFHQLQGLMAHSTPVLYTDKGLRHSTAKVLARLAGNAHRASESYALLALSELLEPGNTELLKISTGVATAIAYFHAGTYDASFDSLCLDPDPERRKAIIDSSQFCSRTLHATLIPCYLDIEHGAGEAALEEVF